MKSVEYIQDYKRAVDSTKVECHDQYQHYYDLLFSTWPMLFNLLRESPDWRLVGEVVGPVFCRLEQSNLFLGVMTDESLLPDEIDEIMETYGLAFWAEAQAEREEGCRPKELLKKVFKGVADWQWEQLIGAVARKEIGKEEDDDMTQTSVIWAVSIAAVIIAFLIYRVKAKISPPGEFAAIRRKAAQEAWARKLVDAGPRLIGPHPWSLELAWPKAIHEMTDDEVTEAMAFFKNLPDFAITTQRGEKFDSKCMEAVGPVADWVFLMERSGLKWKRGVLQHARVQCASADYLALEKTKESELTRKYLKHAKQDLTKDRTLRLDAGALKGVQDETTNRPSFDIWLRSLARAAPDKELEVFEPGVGSRYDNEEMYCFSEGKILALSQAKVTKVLSSGLRRAGTGKGLVLRALVEACD
jgi:hypothetical protein